MGLERRGRFGMMRERVWRKNILERLRREIKKIWQV